ncbi:MAG: PAS domain-containing protein [Candidatus Lokiarchaeota archaeon]|nr:PAS domain-containing protein [Candidatus Lokiarchaeota archaeon]
MKHIKINNLNSNQSEEKKIFNLKDDQILHNLIEHTVFQDKVHTILWANRVATDSINANLSDIIGKKCYEVWAKSKTPCENCPIEAALKSGKSEIGQQTTYDGRGWLIKGYPVKDREGEIIGAIEYTINITEWADLEKVLLNRTKLMHKITDTSPIAITVLDIEGNIVFSNKRAGEIFGINKNEVLKRQYNSEEWFITDFNGNPFPEEKLPYNQVFTTKKPALNVQHCIKNSSGEMKYLSINSVPLFDDNGGLVNIVSTIEDITEEIQTKRRLAKSERSYREAYTQIDLYRDIFSHDINNILQNITTSMELLDFYSNDTHKSEHFTEILKIIEKQVVRGANLSTNVEILSKLEEKSDRFIPINLFAYLKKSITKLKNNIKYNQNIAIIMDQGEKNYYIRGNDLIEYLFYNLLLNSVLHNNSELIEIQIKISKVINSNGKFIKIEFIDNGVGIPHKLIDDISKKSINYNRYEGIGLGFMLIKAIVESFGGKITITKRSEQEPSQGTRFVLSFPEMETFL